MRDNKEGILFPGFWTCTPGGHLKPGEDREVAIKRELFEEFEVKPRSIQFYETFVEKEDKEAEGIYHFFIVKSATPRELIRCHEGQKAVFMTLEEALRLKQHPVSFKMLKRYMQRYHEKGEV